MLRLDMSQLTAVAFAALALSAQIACDQNSVAPDAQAVAPDALDRADNPAANVQCDANNGGLTLPPGFCAVVVAKDVGFARHIAVRPNGDIYVALNNGRNNDVTGAVLALRDTDGDGRADIQQRFGPTGGNGVTWFNGELYFAPNERVLRYSFNGNELVPSATPVTVVQNLPITGDHVSKTVVIDAQGSLFVNIGSATNSCQVQNRVDNSPGIDPCTELQTRAGVWKFAANGSGQTQSLQNRFASEQRNMVALAINPFNGDLYGAQNGRDQLFDNWGQFFTAQDDALLPAEELFQIRKDRLYGWPYCFYNEQKAQKLLAPEYGGTGSEIGRCANRELPLAVYPAHWAPLGMMFYTGTQFPARYRGGLFIAFHGSRFDPSLQPAGPGYMVTFTPFDRAKPNGNFEAFADGFAGGNPTPTGAAHRPVGLAQAPDGSIYVSDDKAGWIWRIFFVGGNSP